MNTLLQISGIGEITYANTPCNFVHFENDIQNDLYIICEKAELKEAIQSLLTGKVTTLYVADVITSVYPREFIESLEGRGVVTTAYNAEHPWGSYALDYFAYSYTPNVPIKVANGTVFRLLNTFKGKFGLSTRAMTAFSFDRIKDNAFENISTTTQTIALCTKNSEGQYEWQSSYLVPDGYHIQAPLTSTDQYAQSCFEGMVVMTSANGDLMLLRPHDNAKRLVRSCTYLGIPPLNEEQILESIRYAILSNKNYLPRPGTDEKLYIRPYVKGLEGGYGVGPAYAYLFAVEVFPYGRYLGRKDSFMSLISIEGKRRSHEGGMGAVKASGNYAQTIRDRQLAKASQIPNYEGTHFDDVLYWGEAKTKVIVNGQELTTVKDVLDEDAAGNIFFIQENAEGKPRIFTPSLNRDSILGGFVRSMLITLARHLGYEVSEGNLDFDAIKTMSGSFVTGSAIGLSKVRSITCEGITLSFDQLEEEGSPTLETFNNLYDSFYALRKGITDHVSDNAEIMSWPYIVGNVNEL